MRLELSESSKRVRAQPAPSPSRPHPARPWGSVSSHLLVNTVVGYRDTPRGAAGERGPSRMWKQVWGIVTGKATWAEIG